MQFLYMGFNQQANIRNYRFQGVIAKERPSKLAKNLEFQLSADLALLARYRIRVQDGPTLCLQILAAGFTSAEEHTIQFASYAITPEDVSAFASKRSALEESKAARRKHRPPFKPSPSSQLKWPRVK